MKCKYNNIHTVSHPILLQTRLPFQSSRNVTDFSWHLGARMSRISKKVVMMVLEAAVMIMMTMTQIIIIFLLLVTVMQGI